MLSLPKHLYCTTSQVACRERVVRDSLFRLHRLLTLTCILALLGLVRVGRAQEAFLRPPCLSLYDLAKLDFYAQQLRQQGIKTLLVYQPLVALDTLAASGRDSTITYLLWADDQANWVRRITCTAVSEPRKLLGYGLLTYVRHAHCAAVQSENSLHFVPPVLTSDRGFIGYNGPTANTYFEINPSTYTPDAQRQRAREYFLGLLDQQLAALRSQWQQAERYQRPELVLDGKKCHGLLFGH